MRKEKRVSLTNGKSKLRRSVVILRVEEVIDILVKWGFDDIKAFCAIKEVIERMGYEMVDGEIVENISGPTNP
jgi:hypothetical protein